MPLVEILNGNHAGSRFDLAADQNVIGRYPFCDIVLQDTSVSRQHAQIVRAGDQWHLEDLGSMNGTFLNGQKVQGRAQLNEGDRIQLYKINLVFFLEPPEDTDDLKKTQLAEPETPVIEVADDADEEDRGTTIVNALDARGDLSIDDAQTKLRAVLEINRNLGSSLDIDDMLQRILDSLFEIFPQADRGFILLGENPDGPLETRAIKQRGDDTNASSTFGPISRTVARRVLSAGEAILSVDLSQDEELAQSESVLEFDIRSMVCAPLLGPRGKPVGIVHVDTKDGEHRFNENDLEVLVGVAAVAGNAVEFAHLHEAGLELARRQRDLQTARDVQLHFLPSEQPLLPGYRFYHHYDTAHEVGGDYFDYVPLPDGRLAMVVGDVGGKGVSAALLMARLCSEVRYNLLSSSSAAEGLARLNQRMWDSGENYRLITIVICVLDAEKHELTVANAGHMPPLRRRDDGRIEEIGVDESGLPLGVSKDEEYQQVTAKLAPDDSVVIYTDGITEAMNPERQLYGLRRLRNAINRAPKRAVESLGRFILADVKGFVKDREQSDDICLLCLARQDERSARGRGQP